MKPLFVSLWMEMNILWPSFCKGICKCKNPKKCNVLLEYICLGDIRANDEPSLRILEKAFSPKWHVLCSNSEDLGHTFTSCLITTLCC